MLEKTRVSGFASIKATLTSKRDALGCFFTVNEEWGKTGTDNPFRNKLQIFFPRPHPSNGFDNNYCYLIGYELRNGEFIHVSTSRISAKRGLYIIRQFSLEGARI